MTIMRISECYYRPQYKSIVVCCRRMKQIGKLFCSFIFHIVATLRISGISLISLFSYLINLSGGKGLFPRS